MDDIGTSGVVNERWAKPPFSGPFQRASPHAQSGDEQVEEGKASVANGTA